MRTSFLSVLRALAGSFGSGPLGGDLLRGFSGVLLGSFGGGPPDSFGGGLLRSSGDVLLGGSGNALLVSLRSVFHYSSDDSEAASRVKDEKGE
ncbi:hypothetical protein L596_011235 [Steinernema carpocapsae]|uniref:Uncharacterized protein n=1 Tax=Steinernema carpocapsae TaxID=34508 RepID=A0A4U5NU78_STECR|nr:hypothetical protein L596_011235 [Steinernema carpocapsae]